MKNINLIPETPYIQRLFLPIIIVVILLFGLFASMLIHSSNEIADERNRLQTEYKEMQLIVGQKQHALAEPLARQYAEFAKEVKNIATNRHDWKKVLDELRSQLPENSHMGQISTDGSTIQAAFLFSDKTSLADYMDKLTKSSLIRNVHLSSITRMGRESQTNQQHVVSYQVNMSITINKQGS